MKVGVLSKRGLIAKLFTFLFMFTMSIQTFLCDDIFSAVSDQSVTNAAAPIAKFAFVLAFFIILGVILIIMFTSQGKLVVEHYKWIVRIIVCLLVIGFIANGTLMETVRTIADWFGLGNAF